MAQGWGKVVARRVEEQVGPELDLDADAIEQFARGAACAVAKGTIEELLEKKAAALGPEQPCPQCQRLCPVKREPRTISFWGADVEYREPQCEHSTAPKVAWLLGKPSQRRVWRPGACPDPFEGC